MVGPGTLALKTTQDGIVTQSFFAETQFFQFWIANHQIAGRQGHLHHHLPLPVFSLPGSLLAGIIDIFSLPAVLFYPGQCLFIFFRIVDASFGAANQF